MHRTHSDKRSRCNYLCSRWQVPSGGHHDCQPEHPSFQVGFDLNWLLSGRSS